MDRNYSRHEANFKSKMPGARPGIQFSKVQCVYLTIFSSLNALRTLRSIACEAHRDAHAAADAQRGEALLGIALLHLMQQCHQHARAGGADRMADRNRAAVDVDLSGIPAEV